MYLTFSRSCTERERGTSLATLRWFGSLRGAICTPLKPASRLQDVYRMHIPTLGIDLGLACRR